MKKWAIDFAQICRLVSMQRTLDLLAWQPRSAWGCQKKGPCLIHGSKDLTSTTFSVNTFKSKFHCFKCHARGNQIDLWAQIHNLPLYDAAIDLCRAAGYEVPRL